MVSAYQHRLIQTAETFAVLLRLILSAVKPSSVLHAGCGTGFIAGPSAEHVDQIDEVDISAGMIAMAKTLPGVDRPNINGIVALIETASLSSPYALIGAAASIHWMDWEGTLPRFAVHLAPQGRR